MEKRDTNAYLLYLCRWHSTWDKSPPRRRFYALWGQFCDLLDLRGNFGFHFPGGRFCGLKCTKTLNCFQK